MSSFLNNIFESSIYIDSLQIALKYILKRTSAIIYYCVFKEQNIFIYLQCCLNLNVYKQIFQKLPPLFTNHSVNNLQYRVCSCFLKTPVANICMLSLGNCTMRKNPDVKQTSPQPPFLPSVISSRILYFKCKIVNVFQ